MLQARVEEHIRRYELIAPGGDVCCLVSGGADSTCLWHVLRALGVGSSRVDLQACKLEYSIVSPK